MKRTILAGLLCLAAMLPLPAQDSGGRRQFDLFGGAAYGPLRFEFAGESAALKVSGTVRGTADGVSGYVIGSPEDLPFSGGDRLILRVSGLRPADEFDMMKLLKLELDGVPQSTVSPGMKSYNDPAYINARNGEAVFDISRLRNIRRINLVFFNCAITEATIEAFYE